VQRDEESDSSLRPFGDPGEMRSDRDARLARTARRSGSLGESRVEEAPPPLTPRSASELLDLALEILRDRFAVIVGTCTLLWVPVRLLEPFIGANAWSDRGASLGETATSLLLLASIGVSAFLQVVVQALATAVVARLAFAAMHGERVPLRAALGEASRRSVGLVVIAFVSGLATTAGICLCFVPSVYLGWRLALAPSAYVLERGGIGASLTRSFALTPGSFLRWLAVIVVLFCLNAPFTTLVAGSVQPQVHRYVIDELGVSAELFDTVLVVLSSIFMGLATAIAAVSMTLFYIDCRVRREGYDLRRTLDDLRREKVAIATAGSAS
jgi:hypothetical protein